MSKSNNDQVTSRGGSFRMKNQSTMGSKRRTAREMRRRTERLERKKINNAKRNQQK